MDPKQTVLAFVAAINAQDWTRLDAVVAQDFVRHSIAAGDPPVQSRADLVEFPIAYFPGVYQMGEV
jgi:hypothetical protein